MTLLKLNKNQLNRWVEELISRQLVIGVQAKGDKFDFAPLQSWRQLRLDYDVTLQPPKQFFLPPREPLLSFAVNGGYGSVLDGQPFVLFGLHPYDLVAINQLDLIFGQDNPDIHYLKRRDAATIVAVDVMRPSKHVFASSMGTAVVEKGFDVLLTWIDDGYLVEAQTEKGNALLSSCRGGIAPTQQDLANRQKVWEHNRKHLNAYQLKCDPAYLPKLLERAYDHPIWEQRAKTCFSCGSCNLVCPTCYCFDVRDVVALDLDKGQRQRCWDGCLLDGFTKVAGGHEFRKARADRFRHRLYRKAKYVPAKIGGQIACVGCGRCVGACLPDIANPVAVFNELLDQLGIS